jgi:hypothetical protein
MQGMRWMWERNGERCEGEESSEKRWGSREGSTRESPDLFREVEIRARKIVRNKTTLKKRSPKKSGTNFYFGLPGASRKKKAC